MALNQSSSFAGTSGVGAAPQGTDGVEGAAGGTQQHPTGPSALDFVRIFATMTLTKKHEEYLEAVTKISEPKLRHLKRVQLPEPMGAQAYIAQAVDGTKSGINIIFADLIPPSVDFLPMSLKAEAAARSLRQLHPDVALVNTILVKDRDLERTQQMAQTLVAELCPQIDQQFRDAAAKDLAVHNDFVVDNNLETARAFIDRISPSAVLPKMDLAITISVRRRTNNMWNNQNPFAKFVQDNQPIPFMAITAMVDVMGPFMDPTTSTQKYQPMIRITSMHSLIPLMGSIFLGQVLAAQNFIQYGNWKRPFMKFAKGTPNLGNLTVDPDGSGKLWFAPDVQSMDTFIAQWLMPPILCMDVVEGQARIPSIHSFADGTPDNQAYLLSEASRFFGSVIPQFMGAPYNPLAIDYIGTVGPADGQQVDSREYTYLNKVCEGALDPNTSRVLLNFFPMPEERARVVSQLSGNAQFLYQDTVVAISGAFLSALSQILPSSGIRVFDPTSQNGVIPLAGFGAQFGNFTGFMSPAYRQQNTGPLYGAANLYTAL